MNVVWAPFRSSRPEVFVRKSILKTCSKFTKKHPCWSSISINYLTITNLLSSKDNSLFANWLSQQLKNTIWKYFFSAFFIFDWKTNCSEIAIFSLLLLPLLFLFLTLPSVMIIEINRKTLQALPAIKGCIDCHCNIYFSIKAKKMHACRYLTLPAKKCRP